jgi:hypothetical protein
MLNLKEIALDCMLAAINARGWKINVFEDNGGGLTLAIWRASGRKIGKTWFCHTGYEYQNNQLVEDLIALAKGLNPAEWENMQDLTPDSFWSMALNPNHGRVILTAEDGLNLWGAAGFRAFKQFVEV